MSRWQAHSGLVLASATISRNGRLLYITGGNDDCVALWDVSGLHQATTATASTSASTSTSTSTSTSATTTTTTIAAPRPPSFSAPSASPAPSATSQNDQLLAALAELVAYRTVSSDPSCAEDCRRGATFLKTLAQRLGATAMLLPTEGGRNPVVFARFSGSGPPSTPQGHGTKRRKTKSDPDPNTNTNPNTTTTTTTKTGKTILFYAHYDVIPAVAGQGWATDPFELTGLNGYLYGRGASDNKGPCLAALFAAGELLREGKLHDGGGDVVFLIEGEEETGSRGFEQAVRSHKQQIGHIDCILLANSYWLDDQLPCLTYGLRGVIHATVTVQSPLPDQHSGLDGSSLYREPAVELVSLLAKLTDDRSSRIAIPGFYDPVRPVTSEEEAKYAPIARALQNNPLSPLAALSADEIQTRLMAKWRFPSLTIHRLDVSGPPNSTTTIPRSASASISLRIVPNQQVRAVAQSLVRHLEQCYAASREASGGDNTMTVHISHQAEPWLGDTGNHVFAALERAVMAVWNRDPEQQQQHQQHQQRQQRRRRRQQDPEQQQQEQQDAVGTGRPLYIREGGSIPGARFLEQEFLAPAAHLPCGQSSDKAHLDNERLRVVNLFKVCPPLYQPILPAGVVCN